MVRNIRKSVQPGTYACYERDGKIRLKPAFGRLRLREITRIRISEAATFWWDEKEYAPKTVNNTIDTLRLALGQAVADKAISSNPAANPGGGTRGRKGLIPLYVADEFVQMDFLSKAEIPLYLNAASDAFRPLAEYLIGAGPRISEALAGRWRDFDPAEGVIWITGSRRSQPPRSRTPRPESARRGRRGRRRGEPGIGPTKSKASRRVELGPRLVGVLVDLRERQVAAGYAGGDADFIFAMPSGSPPNRTTVSRDWHKDTLEAAGLRSTLRLHDLRHTAASVWLEFGSLKWVQTQLGHADVSTTAEMYGHLERASSREAAARAEAAVWAPNGTAARVEDVA